MLPQLDYTTYPLQIFWLLIDVPLLYFCISVIVMPRIDAIINKRQSIVEENQQETLRNNQIALEEEEKYDLAIKKAHLLAQDIIKDSRVLVEQNKVAAYQELKKEVDHLKSKQEQEISILLDNAKKELLDQVMKIIDVYYTNLTLEEVDSNVRKDLEKEIAGIL